MHKYILIFTFSLAFTILAPFSHSIEVIPFFHDEGIGRFDVSSDGKYMVTCSVGWDRDENTYVRVWDIDKSILLQEFIYENSYGPFAAFSPENELLFICKTNSLLVYDTATYKMVKEIKIHTSQYLGNMQFSPNKKMMILSNPYYVYSINLENLSALEEIKPIEDIQILNQYQYESVNANFEEQVINYIYFNFDKSVFFRVEWNGATGLYNKYHNFNFFWGSNLYPYLSTDNKKMFILDDNGVTVYDSVSGKLLYTLSNNFNSSLATSNPPHDYAVAYSIKTFPQFPDYIWVGYSNGILKVWDIEKAKCVVTLYGYQDPIRDFDISLPDNCVYVAGGTQIRKFNINYDQDIHLLIPDFSVKHIYDVENTPILPGSVYDSEKVRNYSLNSQSDTGNSLLAGKDDEIVIAGHDQDGVSLFWYHNDIKEKILSLKWGLYIQSIVPSGNNSFNILVNSFNDQSWKIYKVTGPFQPVSDWVLHK